MCCRNEKSFLVDTKQTGAGLSKVQHIISASLDEILQQLQVQSGHLGYFYYLSVWYSVFPLSLCHLFKQNSSLMKKNRRNADLIYLVFMEWFHYTHSCFCRDTYFPARTFCLFGFVIYKLFPKSFCNNQNRTCWKLVNTWQLPQAPKQTLQLPLVRAKCILIRSGCVITTLLKAAHLLVDKYL